MVPGMDPRANGNVSGESAKAAVLREAKVNKKKLQKYMYCNY